MATFVWYDVMTSDSKAAATFYEKVIGWKAADSGLPGTDYTIFSAGAAMVAGAMDIPPGRAQEGARPCWTGYIGVADVDAFAARVAAAGGAVHRPAEDIPGVGRFAVVADPQGAAFILFTPSTPGQPSGPDLSPGRVGWHELRAGDEASVFGFYESLFGWTKADALDMGEFGTYQMFAADSHVPIGGIMTKPPDSPPHWLYYFNVESIDAACARIAEHHGTVATPPHEVPGGSWIVEAVDPQGAAFALVSPRR